jgi:DNA repair protein RadD
MFTFRPHQIGAIDAVENAFRAGIKRPLVDACVGSGKSLIYAGLAAREVARGGRTVIVAHTRELVEQNAAACRTLGLDVGINAAALSQRDWRAPVISASIQSVYKAARSLGPVSLLCGDESQLWPHAESGMCKTLYRGLGEPRLMGGSGTTFRLQGGSLVEGEGAPFEKVVYTYNILQGIRDGYLCPACSPPMDDKVDLSRLRTRQGDYTTESIDAQMLEIKQMDNHIAQMIHYGSDRRSWLIFEASTKAAQAMAARLQQWGIPAGCVIDKTAPQERARLIEQFRAGSLRALVNVNALTVGFDVPHVDLEVMRRPTKSRGLYIQQIGRMLRTIGGDIAASIAAGKADAMLLDFAGNIDTHGPLDFIEIGDTRKAKLIGCETCGARVAAAAPTCWSCGGTMLKNCPACLSSIPRRELVCSECGHDMRTGGAGPREVKLSDRPSGSALIAAYKGAGVERAGGWLPISQVWEDAGGAIYAKTGETVTVIPDTLANAAKTARWLKMGDSVSVLVPNGTSRTSARQILANGAEIIVPLPAACPT